VPSSTIEGIPARSGGKGRQKERALAGQIVDALASDWEPERYHDTYTEELRTLIKQRSKGAKAEEPEEAPEPEGAEVVDLMAALEASVKDARKGRSGRKRRARRSA
jgi:DNA end-binding protein Ku